MLLITTVAEDAAAAGDPAVLDVAAEDPPQAVPRSTAARTVHPTRLEGINTLLEPCSPATGHRRSWWCSVRVAEGCGFMMCAGSAAPPRPPFSRLIGLASQWYL